MNVIKTGSFRGVETGKEGSEILQAYLFRAGFPGDSQAGEGLLGAHR